MNSGFLGLVKNENAKIYRRPRTWILGAILLAIVIGIGLINHQVSSDVGADEWKDKAQQEMQKNEKMAEKMPDDATNKPVSVSGYNNQELQYYLDHDINPYEKNSWTFVNTMTMGTVSLVVLFVVIIASDIVAGEFTWGTIKMLMVRPHPRWTILLSKYVATIIFGVLLLLELLLSSWLMGGLLYGFGGLDYASYSLDQAGDMTKHVESLKAFKTYGLSLLTIFFIMTISFMLSTIFRSGGLAIGIGILVYFSINILGTVLAQYEWTKYLIFPNLDLTMYLSNPDGLIEGMSIPFSIGVNAGYWVIFVIITWWIFQKRDIST